MWGRLQNKIDWWKTKNCHPTPHPRLDGQIDSDHCSARIDASSTAADGTHAGLTAVVLAARAAQTTLLLTGYERPLVDDG
jgi:hypothetical protein